jgi:hypothetical protein
LAEEVVNPAALDRTIADAKAIRDSLPPMQTSKGGFMTSKKNTVSIALSEDDHATLKALAIEQDRQIQEQARHMLRAALALVQAEKDMVGMELHPEWKNPPHRCPHCDASLGAPHTPKCPNHPVLLSGATSAAEAVPSATYLAADSTPDATPGEQQRAKQEPLPG